MHEQTEGRHDERGEAVLQVGQRLVGLAKAIEGESDREGDAPELGAVVAEHLPTQLLGAREEAQMVEELEVDGRVVDVDERGGERVEDGE